MKITIESLAKRREQNAALYRKCGWHLQLSTPIEARDERLRVEFWIKGDGSGHQSIAVIHTFPNGEQHIENFFQAGGSTWDGLERELTRVPERS